MTIDVFTLQLPHNMKCEKCGMTMGPATPTKMAKKVVVRDGENSATVICHSSLEAQMIIEKAKEKHKEHDGSMDLH